MSEVFPVPGHLLDSDLARINLNLDFLDVIHYDLAVLHLEKDRLHLYLLQLVLDQVIYDPHVYA